MKELKKFITPTGKPLSNIIQLSKKVHNPYLENHLKKVQTKKKCSIRQSHNPYLSLPASFIILQICIVVCPLYPNQDFLFLPSTSSLRKIGYGFVTVVMMKSSIVSEKGIFESYSIR
jgi:hypothetical protein